MQTCEAKENKKNFPQPVYPTGIAKRGFDKIAHKKRGFERGIISQNSKKEERTVQKAKAWANARLSFPPKFSKLNWTVSAKSKTLSDVGVKMCSGNISDKYIINRRG